MDYTELVNTLRYEATWCEDFPEQKKLFLDAADAIEELQGRAKVLEKIADKWCDAVPTWIPVTARLPEQGKRYLVIRFDEVTKTPFVDILWHDANDLWWNRLYKGKYNVTHWMPLPPPPQKGEG